MSTSTGSPDPAPESYAAAVTELEDLLAEIEGSDIDVDRLVVQVERAAALIEWCRERILVARQAVDDVTERLLDDSD